MNVPLGASCFEFVEEIPRGLGPVVQGFIPGIGFQGPSGAFEGLFVVKGSQDMSSSHTELWITGK